MCKPLFVHVDALLIFAIVSGLGGGGISGVGQGEGFNIYVMVVEQVGFK